SISMVYRVDAENRKGRLDLEPLALANTRNGEIRPQGGREVTKAERNQIEDWIRSRQNALAEAEAQTPSAAIEAMNAAAHWVQSKASAAEIDTHANDLLLAMHDLRSQIVRRQADALKDTTSEN
ncbi:MAG: hypothetical protein AAGO57_07905, partial [Pseudomonadota bacterium]